MEAFTEWLVMVKDMVWGVPLIVLILGCGLWLTVRVRLLQVFHLGKALRFMIQNEEEGHGEVTSFGALCTALSATIGTGNIVGVASAICAGGPGALFWMEVAAFFGMATKYAEGLLAIKYRSVAEDGHVLRGPFYYIERGMGERRCLGISNWKWLARLFAVFGTLAGLLGIGTITQINGITTAAQNFFDPNKNGLLFVLAKGTANETGITYTTVIAGLLVTLCAALVIIGGIKRIAKVSEVIVPFMAVLYVVCGMLILICNVQAIPTAVYQIVVGAFAPQAVAGGIVGVTVKTAIQMGVARGIFSNEAGLGSAPIAAAAAKTKDTVRQGLVTMTGTFIDTIIICTMTGLSIIIAGAWQPELGLEGAEVTMYVCLPELPALPVAGRRFPPDGVPHLFRVYDHTWLELLLRALPRVPHRWQDGRCQGLPLALHRGGVHRPVPHRQRRLDHRGYLQRAHGRAEYNCASGAIRSHRA